MKTKTIVYNTQQILTDDISSIVGVLVFGTVLYLGLTFVHIENMHGNMGFFITYAQIISHRLLAILFGIFIAATVYKVRRMNELSSKNTSSGILSGLLSTIIVGCPACSISIASYIGLGGFLVQLPRFGLEVKLLGILLLGRATYTTIRDLYLCKKQ